MKTIRYIHSLMATVLICFSSQNILAQTIPSPVIDSVLTVDHDYFYNGEIIVPYSTGHVSVTNYANVQIHSTIDVDLLSGFTASVDSGCVEFVAGIRECPEIIVSKSIQPISCSGKADAFVKLLPSGGISPYHFNWSNRIGNQNIARNLDSGSYFIQITDNSNCHISDTVTIVAPPPISIISQISASSCLDSNGSAHIIPSGGSQSFSYHWLPYGGNNSNANNLTSGSYTILVKDQFNCANTISVFIPDSNGTHIEINSIQNATCAGIRNGSIELINDLRFNKFNWYGLKDSTNYISELGAGRYYVNAIDTSGCKSFLEIDVTEPPPISISFVTTNTTCLEDTGTALANVEGGIEPYTFQWSSGGNDSFDVLLPAGNDTLFIVDQNGCQFWGVAHVQATDAIQANLNKINDLTCFNSNDGSAEAIVTSGTGPFSYLWLPDSITSSIATNLTAGIHNIIISGSSGCAFEDTILIDTPPPLEVHVYTQLPTSDTTYNGQFISDVQGGTTPYNYNWIEHNSTNSFLDSLTLGNTDSLIVIDGKGCSTSGRVMISSIANPVCYTANTNTCLPTPVVTCPVGTPCIKDIVDDFGADPTGSINSDCAFASATDFFNNRGGEGILTIPPGTYIVGKQSYHARPLDPSYPFGLTGRDIFCFTNCNNLIIRGKIAASPPIIKFDDCLKYGMFDESFQERYLTQWMANSVSDYYRLATTGSFLVLNNCENITIESLIVDGNSDNYIYGGSYSDGIQIPSNGIEIHSSNDITINGVYIHHFGLEGILIADELNLNPTTFAINIFNSKFNWNGRDGIYFKGGSGVNAINCQFNYNAMTRYGMGNGAGMSFEYNGGYLPSNSTFINCEFKFNQRYGILCAPPDQFQPYNASNFTFKECEIVSAEYNLSGNGIASHAASLYGPQFHFRKCNFYGQCIQGFQEVNAHRDWGLEFTEDASITLSHIGCGFYEDYNNFSHNSSLLDECNTGLLNSGPISYLVELGPIGKALFRYAKIISNKQLKLMHMTGGTQPLNKILFENSEIRNYGLNGPDRTLGSLVNHIQRNTYYKFVDPALFNGVYFVMYAQPTLDQNYVFRTLTPANCLPKYRNPIYPNAVTNVCVCNSCNPITLPYSCPSDCDPCLDARISFESEEMNEKDEIILNPNPVVNMLLISNLSSGKNIFCYNSVGQCIFTNTSTSNYFEINLSNLQSGMYLIKVDGKKSQRFIKLQEQ